ncbi:PP2C family protein-serine/threonine phosphatase [candidate division KSB1 bacterium]|nr:PP2C family protein-serine/threonine phosphatase [candidate division KSB1 bacterium]
MKKRALTYFILIVLALIGVFFFILNYKSIYLSAHINIQFSKTQIIEKAQQSLKSWGYDDNRYKISTEFRAREGLLRFLNETLPKDSLEQILKHKLPAYYWSVTWDRPKNFDQDLTNTNEMSFPNWFRKIGLHFDQEGNEFAFWVEADRDSASQSLTESRVRILADSVFAYKLGPDTSFFVFNKIKQTTRNNRVDFSVIYNRKADISQIPVQLQIDVLGNRIGKFEYVYERVEGGQPARDRYFKIVTSLLIYLGLIVLFIYIFIKKLRSDEISIRAALPVGITLFIFNVLDSVIRIEHFDIEFLLIRLIISPVLMGFVGVIVVSCADAITRDVWNEKLLTYDSLLRGHVRHRLFGQSIIRGVLFGFILIGATTLLLKCVSFSVPVNIAAESHNIADINSHFPFLYRFASNFNSLIWAQFVFVLFLASFFARYFNRHAWLVLSAGLFWGFGYGLTNIITSPVIAAILYFILMGIFFIILFLKYDFLTSFVAQFTHILVFESVRMIYFDNINFIIGGAFFAGIIVLMILLGISGLGNIIQKDELLKYSPQHVKKIFERERLKRELEIAKRVQLSFLPRSNPEFANLDIASICYPAEEVGGDYYDFIKLSDRRLGVAIGDVSGKGISAAFYMTLTKGFLRSLTRSPLSPRDVLKEMNSLFYENVERNHFVSMIYGIFDLDKKSFTFSRAGHNPIISRKNNNGAINVMCPRGIALGMDKGGIFDSVIEEKILPIETGDIFVFYTDGFTEAMNNDHQEFGEKRLEKIISECDHANSDLLLNKIKVNVKEFAGSMSQHDDMTMLVVRVC